MVLEILQAAAFELQSVSMKGLSMLASFATPGRPRQRRAPATLATITMLLLPAHISAAKLQSERNPKRGKLPALRNSAPGEAYVGSKVCSECHADIYRQYIKTDMGRSMSLPSPHELEKVAAPITIRHEKFNRYFEIFREGSRLYESEYELDAEGKEVFRNTQELKFVVGAGANGSGYIVRRGEYLFEAPLAYYSKTKTWGLSPGYEFGDYGFSRPILPGCVACHSGLPQPVRNRDGLYQDPPFRELAIGCENCHGPGQSHVEERRKGAPLSGDVDRRIFNPSKLPGWLADNICMNCHQGGDARVLQPGRDYFDFRPGTPLDNTLAIFAVPFSRESPPKDPLLQHYALMILSKCYLQSGGRLSCITCHDPHRQPSPDEAPRYYKFRCLNCHTEKSCALPLEVRTRETPPDDCAGCHMPKQNLKVIAHSSLTNHRIIAREGEPYPESAFHQTTPQLPDLVHLNAIPGAAVTAVPPITLLRTYGELMTSHPEYRVRYDAVLNELAQTETQDVFVLSALARRKLSEGTPQGDTAALGYISRAVELGSTEASDYELLANLQTRSGNTTDAIATLQRGIALNPYSSRLYKVLALQFISKKAYPDALQIMRKELELFPEDSFMRMLVKKAESTTPGP